MRFASSWHLLMLLPATKPWIREAITLHSLPHENIFEQTTTSDALLVALRCELWATSATSGANYCYIQLVQQKPPTQRELAAGDLNHFDLKDYNHFKF